MIKIVYNPSTPINGELEPVMIPIGENIKRCNSTGWTGLSNLHNVSNNKGRFTMPDSTIKSGFNKILNLLMKLQSKAQSARDAWREGASLIYELFINIFA